MDKPRYFIAVFGAPQPDKDAVESGVYAPDTKYAPFPTQPGDMILLYCTANYGKYALQSPGVGVVLRSDMEHIEYRWLPFAEAVPKAVIDASLDPEDAAKLKNIRFSSHWLFQISQSSFSRVVRDRIPLGSVSEFFILRALRGAALGTTVGGWGRFRSNARGSRSGNCLEKMQNHLAAPNASQPATRLTSIRLIR
ncbi:MAG TPA: hypothetical protein VKX49_24455 [Bryobacteraceae bacterium]|nr:hypothetical protein [Bryobacteraceae bacterium]